MRITFKDAAYVLMYHEKHYFERFCCNWYISMENANSGRIKCVCKWWIYALLFIPFCLIHFVWCLWDGGLKEFCVEPPTVHNWCVSGLTCDKENTQFGRLKIVHERNKK